MYRLILVTLDYIFVGLIGVAVLMALDLLYRLGHTIPVGILSSMLHLVIVILLEIGIKVISHYSANVFHHPSSHSPKTRQRIS